MASSARVVCLDTSVVYHCPQCDVRTVDPICWICGQKLTKTTLSFVNGPRMRPPFEGE